MFLLIKGGKITKCIDFKKLTHALCFQCLHINGADVDSHSSNSHED